MSRPKIVVPGTAATIRRQRQEQRRYDENPKRYERQKREWSLEESQKRGCLPTGEPLSAKFGPGFD